jgi:hypothetical protein
VTISKASGRGRHTLLRRITIDVLEAVQRFGPTAAPDLRDGEISHNQPLIDPATSSTTRYRSPSAQAAQRQDHALLPGSLARVEPRPG